MSEPTSPEQLPAGPPGPVRAVTVRSVLIGLVGVLFICGLTPYNDYVMNNTFLVGNFLPIGLVMFILALVMLVNAPLWKWAPGRALSAGELAVVLGMMLVSCTLPSSGLMRYVPAHLVGLHYHAGPGGEPLTLLQELNLPDWLFPEMEADDIQARANDPIVADYWNRISTEDDRFVTMLRAVPWGAWVRPMLTWGLLLIAMYGAVFCLSVIVRRQWAENERLAFPLASIYMSLIETPQPRQGLNALFGSSWFWIAFFAVFILHGFNAMHQYVPRVWPEIPIAYDFEGLFADSPLRHTEWAFKRSRLYFSIIGIAFFLQTKIAFSLWGFYILMNLVMVLMGEYQMDFTGGMRDDQQFGALMAFCGALIWIGRHHWMLVLRQMMRGAAPDEPQGRYLPYPVAGWGFVICSVGMVTWLATAGMTVPGAVLLAMLMLLLFMVVARVVAETGLIFVQISFQLNRPWMYMLNDLPEPMQVRTSTQDYFFTNWFRFLFTHDMRESFAPYAVHAMRVADLAAYERARSRRPALLFTGALLLALVFGFFVAGGSTLYVNYAYAVTQDVQQQAPVNFYGTDISARNTLNESVQFMPPNTGPREVHNRLGHFGFGVLFTAGLAAMRMRYVAWPLHPIGFLLVHSYPIRMIWFSIMVGWLLKVLIVRFGGAELFRQIRPLFIGMIIGEAGAAAFWLVVSLVLNQMGYEYHAVRLLPG